MYLECLCSSRGVPGVAVWDRERKLGVDPSPQGFSSVHDGTGWMGYPVTVSLLHVSLVSFNPWAQDLSVLLGTWKVLGSVPELPGALSDCLGPSPSRLAFLARPSLLCWYKAGWMTHGCGVCEVLAEPGSGSSRWLGTGCWPDSHLGWEDFPWSVCCLSCAAGTRSDRVRAVGMQHRCLLSDPFKLFHFCPHLFLPPFFPLWFYFILRVGGKEKTVTIS